MFPVSFAPYIIKLIAPKLTEKIANHIAKVFKLPQLVNYMELPNELDDQVADIRIELKVLKQHIIDLDKDSHPEKPFEDRITALENIIAK